MSLKTKLLELFKYEPDKDGAQTFNIKSALNDNWDKIEAWAQSVKTALAKLVPTSRTVNGKTLSADVTLTGENIAVSTTDSTPISGAVKYRTNPNLLDNWYFGRPVNQRGQTEYTSNYTIDRWWLQADTSLNVVDGGVNVIGKWDIEQFFEKALPNRTYTLSLLYKDKTGSDPLRLIAANRSSGDVVQKITKDASGLLSITFTSGNCDKIVIGFAGSTDNVATLLAVKLELGSTQTLAHQNSSGNWVLNEIPDFGEQLRRCQRYCRPLPHKLDVCLDSNIYFAYTEESFEEMRSIPICLTNLVGKNVLSITESVCASITNVYTFNMFGGVAIALSQNPNTDIVFLDSKLYLISADL